MRRGTATRTVLTGDSRVTVRRRRYGTAAGGTDVPVDNLVDLAERRPKVDYPASRAGGLDVGSGPTEAMCPFDSAQGEALARRMAGVGMRRAVRDPEPMVALEGSHQSDLWPAYWSSRLAA